VPAALRSAAPSLGMCFGAFPVSGMLPLDEIK
jgi:hypothetical protein